MAQMTRALLFLLLILPAAASAATLVIAAAVALGSTATTVTAAAIYLASTAATLASIGYSIYSALNKPSQSSVGPRLGDLAVQSSARGVPIPKVWGSMRLAGNLIDGKKYEERIEESVGGKFGGGGGTAVSYKYFADFAVSLCEGPITGVRRIWLNSKLWYSAADDASETELEASADHEKYGKLYLGTATQMPDPTLEAIHGAGNVPPYRRTAYIVFTRLPLENFGNAIPNVSVEVCNTPATFTAPTVIFGSPEGGFKGVTNIVRDPETGRLFMNLHSDPYLRVYDASFANGLRVIALPGKVGIHESSTPCYVSSTREIWVPYRTSTLTIYGAGASIAIIDPDALVVKASFPVGDMGRPAPALYNPVTDQVLVQDLYYGDSNLRYFNPHTRVGVLDHNLFGMIFSDYIYIRVHQIIVVWGRNSGGLAADRLRIVHAGTYGLIAEFTASEFGAARNWVSYDKKRDVLYWCCGDTPISRHLYTIDLDPLSHGGTPVLGSARTLPQDPRDGMCFVYGMDRIYIRDSSLSGADIFGLDPVTLAVEASIDGVTETVRTGLYPIDGRRFIVAGDHWKVPIKALLPNSGAPLSQIVQDLCRDTGLALGDLDTVALTDTVHGYVRAQPMQATAALAPLMLTYQFDGVETDWLLTFPKRTGSSVGTIPEDDLGACELGQDPGPPLAILRMQETDLPTALSIHYPEPALHYQVGSQIHRRVYTRSQQTMQIDLPIAMPAIDARQLTRRLMNRSWVERTRYRFAVGPEYLRLDPGDIVKVVADNATHLVRLDKVEFGAPGLVLAEGVAQRITLLPYLDEVADDLDAAPIYEEGEEEPPPDEIPPPDLAPVPNTRLVLIDLPIFLDQHNDAGFYYAVCGYAAGWHGAVLYKSIDAGATYSPLDAMTTPAAIGGATTALASGPTTIWDHGSIVNVYLTQGTLASDTEANVLAGTNMAAFGAHGRWEVLQWQTATLEADGSYTLSNLLRGRKGTEHAVGSHEIGDTFVALSAVDRSVMQSGELGLARTYKAASIGGSFVDASAQAFMNTGVGLEPYSPVHLKGTRVASGDLTITWIRRTRAQGEWRDLVDVPLFEDTELYDLEVLNGPTVVRSWTGLTAASQVYSAANQLTDFGSNQPAVSVRVYQRSTLAGRGYPGSATL